MVLVLAGVPAVTARSGVVDTVGGDQSAIQQQVVIAGRDGVLHHIGEIRRLGGPDVEGFVQVAVGRGQLTELSRARSATALR